MRPKVSDVRPVTGTELAAVEVLLGTRLPPALAAVIPELNGGRPDPRYVPCSLFGGETRVPVYEFARWDEPEAYVELCRAHHDGLGEPRRFLVLATSDADTFFVDLEDPGLRVMYFQYLEGDYRSHFGDGEMDCVADSLDGFLSGFFDGQA
jgi:hypothetical protein